MNTLTYLIQSCKVDETVKLLVYSSGKEKEVEVKLQFLNL